MNLKHASVSLTAAAFLCWGTRAGTIPLECISQEPGAPQPSVPSFDLELSGDTLALSGTVAVNCCAKKTIAYSVNDTLVAITFDIDGLCECVDLPCRFVASIPGCFAGTCRVAIESNLGAAMLDTTVARPAASVVPRRGTRAGIMEQRPALGAHMYDLRGRAVAASRPQGRRGTGAGPHGVYVERTARGEAVYVFRSPGRGR